MAFYIIFFLANVTSEDNYAPNSIPVYHSSNGAIEHNVKIASASSNDQGLNEVIFVYSLLKKRMWTAMVFSSLVAIYLSSFKTLMFI